MIEAPSLSGPSLPPSSGGPARKLVILLHGLGADGRDLIGLAPQFAPSLPEAEFLAPNAPFPCDMAPVGHQWFSLRDTTPAMMLAGIEAAAPSLDAFIDTALAERGLGESDLALVGFSQGTMMALHVAPRRSAPMAGVLGYSGALVGAEKLSSEVRSRPPVLLIHGDADEIVPAQMLQVAAEGLTSAGLPVRTQIRQGLAHGIDMEGMALGLAFLKEVLA